MLKCEVKKEKKIALRNTIDMQKKDVSGNFLRVEMLPHVMETELHEKLYCMVS